MLNKRVEFSLVLIAMSLLLFTFSACSSKTQEIPIESPAIGDREQLARVIGDSNLNAPLQSPGHGFN